MSSGHLTVGIVGGGPRGLSVLERICANERKSPSNSSVTVHVVDPYRPGPGKVWRTAQSRHLLMNTVACQVTVYTDDSVVMDGPVEEGPSLYAWAAQLARTADTRTARTAEERAFLDEARRTGPDSYASRALYGRYLTDCFDRVVERAPDHVTVRVHRQSATALDDGPLGTQVLALADGTLLAGLDAVVLAQGHLPARPSPHEARTMEEARAHGLTYIPPASPADVDLSVAEPGQPVLLRGLGLNFFDETALLTVGRGGRFDRDAGGRLRYLPSGREPTLYAGSRRGVPYHARGENEKGAHGRHRPRLLTPERIARLTARADRGEQVRFGTDVWPLIAKEVESVYYGTLLATRGRAAECARCIDRYVAARPGEEAALLDAYGIPAADRWDWDRISLPYGRRVFTDRSAFRDWLLAYLDRDVREARAGNVNGPLKAALDVLRDLRNEIRLVVDHGRLEGNSYRDDLQGWYTPLNAFLSIGPPVSRIEELIALVEAGTVRPIGPGMQVRVISEGPGAPAFEAVSDRVGGDPVRATVLVEARLPESDVRRTDDPLLAHLLATGQATAYRIAGAHGTSYQTGGMTVTERPYRVVAADGRAHPRRFAYGVPTEAVHWATAAGIRPGVNSVTLGDSDALARAVLELTPAGDGGTPGDDLTGAGLKEAPL
ncbi:FAD/NAD(P)-binding protein [Streptomyces sp. NPDC057743]|uniref:FAD/NAD(P)-binding protein n=1 Tax=Streptomyces sp. NPDC057743 TaxID=3346236 RepID=UPI003689BF67